MRWNVLCERQTDPGDVADDLTLSLAHVSTAVEAAERVVDAVNIRLADTPAVRGPSSTLRRGPVNCPLLLN